MHDYKIEKEIYEGESVGKKRKKFYMLSFLKVIERTQINKMHEIFYRAIALNFQFVLATDWSCSILNVLLCVDCAVSQCIALPCQTVYYILGEMFYDGM